MKSNEGVSRQIIHESATKKHKNPVEEAGRAIRNRDQEQAGAAIRSSDQEQRYSTARNLLLRSAPAAVYGWLR